MQGVKSVGFVVCDRAHQMNGKVRLAVLLGRKESKTANMMNDGKEISLDSISRGAAGIGRYFQPMPARAGGRDGQEKADFPNGISWVRVPSPAQNHNMKGFISFFDIRLS